MTAHVHCCDFPMVSAPPAPPSARELADRIAAQARAIAAEHMPRPAFGVHALNDTDTLFGRMLVLQAAEQMFTGDSAKLLGALYRWHAIVGRGSHYGERDVTDLQSVRADMTEAAEAIGDDDVTGAVDAIGEQIESMQDWIDGTGEDA